MIVRDKTAGNLASIAEQMAMVVDKGLRARLSGEYLELLREFHTGRPARNFANRTRTLLKKVEAARRQYKLTPGLGTISERFYASYGNAVKSLERLSKLADRQRDPGLRSAWLGFLKDAGFRLENLYAQAEYSSANVNLSRLDSLANSVNNLLASMMLPAEVEWAKRLGVTPTRVIPTSGRSGVVAKTAFPSMKNPGYSTPAATIAQRKRPYYRKARVSEYGHGPGLSDLYEDYAEVVEGAWENAQAVADSSVKDVEVMFNRAAETARALGEVQTSQQAGLAALASKDPERASGLKDELEQQKIRLASATTKLNEIAAEMKRWSYDSLDAPLETMKNLGLGQTEGDINTDVLVTDRTAPATWLLFSGRIREASEELVALKTDSDKLTSSLDQDATGAAVAAGGGIALVAGGALLYLLTRKRR